MYTQGQSMKIELSNVDGFHTYASLTPANHPEGYQSLKITTQWETARNPVEEQVKYTLLLSPSALNNLRTLIK
jgi:hypothetical protein